uniref:Uncharacterized protein n=1 Tax=Octopus bimaculoides TaxID=37653 RepID=A0A0L8FPQ8_OCTBM
MVAVVFDGTAANTGSKGHILRHLDDKLKKPLYWFVYQLHANELPLSHLINDLDRKTTGPRGFLGPIGKRLGRFEALSVVKFNQIPSVDRNDLSTDHF